MPAIAPELAYAYQSGRVAAITGDVLAMLAAPEVLDAAAALLDRAEMCAWTAEDQAAAAVEIRALRECYHGAR